MTARGSECACEGAGCDVDRDLWFELRSVWPDAEAAQHQCAITQHSAGVTVPQYNAIGERIVKECFSFLGMVVTTQF